jgi:hypothetical protein
MTQFKGSMGAWARSGKTYSASMIFAALAARAGGVALVHGGLAQPVAASAL